VVTQKRDCNFESPETGSPLSGGCNTRNKEKGESQRGFRVENRRTKKQPVGNSKSFIHSRGRGGGGRLRG